MLSLVTRKIACVAYVIPAIFLYDSLDRIYTLYVLRAIGAFQTAGYIGPLKIYAADAAPGYTVPLPGHYNLGYIVPRSAPRPRYSSATRGCQNGRRVGGGQYSLLQLWREESEVKVREVRGRVGGGRVRGGTLPEGRRVYRGRNRILFIA